MAVLKRLAARTQPWRTPEEMENASEIVPFTLTTLWVDECRVLMISTSCRPHAGHVNLAAAKLWGLCKEKNPRLLWKWVGGSRSHSEYFVVENHPNITLNQY